MSDSWAFLDQGFRWDPEPALLDWSATIAIVEARRRMDRPRIRRLREVLARWDELLSHAGGEPLCEDWIRFRPLRRDREEDWSDWLAHLIESSRTGRLAAHLFGRRADSSTGSTVDRELVIGQRRLDIRVTWTDGTKTHVETKVGDTAFLKTFETAALHREAIGDTRCDDWILVPPEHAEMWRAVSTKIDTTIIVGLLTWSEVAVGLRQCVAAGQEQVSWLVWARAFVGCIEQELLGFPRIDFQDRLDDDGADFIGLLGHLEGGLDGI